MLDLEKKFSRKKAQKKVARFFLEKGLRVEKGKIYSSSIEIQPSKISRVLNIDRRVVISTAKKISDDSELRKIFSKLNSTLLLRDVAKELGFGAIEIIPESATKKGIVAGVTKIISDAGISIRQLIAQDPMLKNARMNIITEKPIPRNLINKILRIKGVKEVVVLS